MVSLASIKESQHSHILSVLGDFPTLARQTIAFLEMPVKPPDYRPLRLEVHFNGKLILLQEGGSIVYEVSGFAPNYRPNVLSIYGDGELLFVRFQTEVLLNRLPQVFVTGWTNFDTPRPKCGRFLNRPDSDL